MRRIEAKVVVLGSKGVGKTALITKYIKNTLHEDIGLTMAYSFFTCKVTLDNIKITLKIWDTAGQERFKAMPPMFYRDACAAILVFDLSLYKSFSDIKSWIHELHRIVHDPVILTLVGNKLDLNAERAVSLEEASIFATSINACYFETSAQSEQGLEEVFTTTARGLVRLANEGKSRSLRQFESSDSLSAYTNHHTAFSHSTSFRLPMVPIGIPVEGDDIKTNAEGRLETPSWSIEHIAFGEELPVGCCM